MEHTDEQRSLLFPKLRFVKAGLLLLKKKHCVVLRTRVKFVALLLLPFAPRVMNVSHIDLHPSVSPFSPITNHAKKPRHDTQKLEAPHIKSTTPMDYYVSCHAKPQECEKVVVDASRVQPNQAMMSYRSPYPTHSQCDLMLPKVTDIGRSNGRSQPN